MEDGLNKLLDVGAKAEKEYQKADNELLEALERLAGELGDFEIRSDQTLTLIDDVKSQIRDIRRLLIESRK